MHKLSAVVRGAAVFVDHWQWAILSLTAPWLLFPTPLRTPLLLIVPGLWIVAGLSRREFLPRTPLNGSLLVLAVMILVSLFATYDVAVSLPKIAGLILGLGVFFAVARLASWSLIWRLSVIAFLALGVGIAGLGLLGTQWLNKIAFLAPLLARLPLVLRGLPGAEGGFQPNEVAGSLLWVLPALLIVTIQQFRDRLNRRRFLALIVSLCATLFVLGVFTLTQSRSGYIGLAAGVSLLLVIGSSPRLRFFMLIGSVILIVAVGGWLLSGSGAAVQDQPASSALGSGAVSLDTLEGRLEVWSRAIYGIEDFPLTGMGLNTFRSVVQVLYPSFLISPDVDLGHAHNEFLQAALDLGLPGLIAFGALYLGAFWMVARIWRTTESASWGSLSSRALALGLGGGLFAHLVYGLTDAVALGAKPGFLFWMSLGLITGLFLQIRPDRHSSSSLDRGIIDTNATKWT